MQRQKFRHCWKEGIHYNTEGAVWTGSAWSGEIGKLPPLSVCQECHDSQNHEHPKEEICSKCRVCALSRQDSLVITEVGDFQ